MNREERRWVLKAQRSELTEHHIYSRLARAVSDEQDREVLERIAADELRHSEMLREHTGRSPAPNWLKVWWFYLLARLFGYTFVIKLMEAGENRAHGNYGTFNIVPEGTALAQEEHEHEERLIGMLDEDRLKYTGAVVRGLNDALVELTGALAGFTLAFAQPRVVAMAGLITGVSASLSMAGSEYLGRKSEDDELSPARAATYTGLAYALTVMVLIAPYMVFSNLYLCLGVMLAATLLIIAFFNYYMAVARGQPFGARFLEMAGISLGIAALSFGIGALVRRCLPVEV
ncbi:MAG: rubrerythrin family protein [Candidatus Brocadiaceae bacterium]|nr:rubrerythrin family protein [Candidatus Brocadiaceae bacterium]